MNITLSSVLMILNKTIDIVLVWVLIYYAIKNFQENVKLSLLIKGVVFVVILKLIASVFGFVTIGVILEYLIMFGPIAIIVIFQPEIRMLLEELGRKKLIGRHKILTVDKREKVVYEIVSSLEALRKERYGALIVIERNVSLSDYIEKAKPVYGDVTSNLLQCIFFKNNPLHDGGVIIQGDKIACAGAVFPTSSNIKNSQKRLGTRHRAALGIAEETDALVLVASEETGRLSMAIKGELYYNVSIDDIRVTLIDELRPQKEEAVEVKNWEEEEIYEENK